MDREVSFFRNGDNQVLQIPKDMELPGKTAVIRKDGDRLIIEPKGNRSLLDLLASFDPLPDDGDLGPIDDPLAENVEL